MRTILLLLALTMPVTAETAGLILGPYFQIAELLASTDKWQELTGAANVTEALTSIAFPEYVDFESPNEDSIKVPLSGLSNPWDMMTELFGQQDPQGRVDHGQLLWQLFLQTDTDADGLRNFIHEQETLLAEMAALSGMAKPGGWHIKVLSWQLAFAPGRVPLANLRCIPRGETDSKPQSVTTGAFVLDWTRS